MDRKTVITALKHYRGIEADIKQKLEFFREIGEEEYQEQAAFLRTVKKTVIFHMNRLPQNERNAVWSHYVKGDSWVRVSIKYAYSERQIRNIANAGLDKLAAAFSKDPWMVDFCGGLTI